MYLDRLEKKQIKYLMKDWDKYHEKTIDVVLVDETVVSVENNATAVADIINKYCNNDAKTKYNSLTHVGQYMVELYIEAKSYLQQIGVDEIEDWIKDFDNSDIQELEDMEYDIQHGYDSEWDW